MNTITQQEIPDDAAVEDVPIKASLSTLPPGVNAAQFHAAELLSPKRSPEFQNEYLYASNRNTDSMDKNPGDSISIFSTEPLKLVAHVFTGLNQIRGMEFGGENERYLIAGGAAGGGLAVFERITGGANLKLLARSECR